ncbi:uncharacterized protein [Dysidea avara]|uniref:uncharacterized protein n=1 Tax=Dysidea avara TaxID=196820 RepID=UPI00332C7ACE
MHIQYTYELVYQKYSNVITVNIDGNDDNSCCVDGHCECSSLESALNHIRNDKTLINITSPIVPLSFHVKISEHKKIGIFGNNGTVISCNNTGGVSLVNCKDIDISGITWDRCGGAGLTGAVTMEQSSNISISNCTFQQLGNYGIVILVHDQHYNNWDSDLCTLSTIEIINCTFMNNFASFKGIYVSANQSRIVLKLSYLLLKNNLVDYSGNAIYCYTDGNYANFTMFNSTIMSSIYIQLNSLNASLSIYKSSFINPVEKNIQLYTETYSKYLLVDFSGLILVGIQVVHQVRGYPNKCVLSFNELRGSDNSSLHINGTESFGFQSYIRNSQFYNNNDKYPVVDIYNVYYPSQHPDICVGIEIFNCVFYNNSNGKHVVLLAYDDEYNDPLGNVHLSHTNFTDNFENENTLYLQFCNLTVYGTVFFQDNEGISGAGIYFTDFSQVLLSDGVEIVFSDNVAALGGAAIYADYPLSSAPWSLFSIAGHYTATFLNNQAHGVGNSIFINIPVAESKYINKNPSSQSSIVYIPQHFNFSGTNEIVTSPYGVSLGPPAQCLNKSCEQHGCYIIKNIMLGEEVLSSARMIDYFNNTAETALFHVKCMNCRHHRLKRFSQMFIYIGTSESISIIGEEVKNHHLIILQLSSVRSTISQVPDISILVKLLLSPCHIGYKYDSIEKMCICSDFSGIVLCSNPVKIKRGYWYGTINGQRAVVHCPNNYCDYSSCPVGSEFCNVSSFECSSHRSGIACGTCAESYTLPFDSDNCIPIDKCQAWQSIVVVLSVIVYWIIVIVSILVLLYLVTVDTVTCYVHGIVFFYSVLEVIIGEDLIISDGLRFFVTILSSLVNLSPMFLGKLCLAKGLSGIDQQFVHYIHPLAIILLLLLVVVVAKRSARITFTFRKHGVRYFCLLLILFYKSLSSTSWQLLRPLTFEGVDGVYTYLSPDIKYFSGRHILYGLIAILCGIVIVLGLPILLLFEPFLRKKYKFAKVRPILDQYQGCYKNKYHCFAAFYLICRLVMFIVISLDVLEIGNRYLVLQILCLVIILIHAWVQPYKNSVLNSLDLSILVIMLTIVSLNVGAPYAVLLGNSTANDLIVAILILLPVIMFTGFLVHSNNFCRGILLGQTRNDYISLQRPRPSDSEEDSDV